LSFKFIAIAYGMLGATAATGYMVQGGGGGGAVGSRSSTRVAEAPKVERVAKLEMPPKPGLMPQVAMVATGQQDDSVAVPAPPPAMVVVPVAIATVPSAMPLTAPPTPPPPPAEPPSRMAAHAEKIADKPVDKPAEKLVAKAEEMPAERPAGKGLSRNYLQITADMMVNPWTGEWLTSDDRSMGYISGPATGKAPAAIPSPVMVAEQPPATPAAAEAPVAVAAAPPPLPEPVRSPPVMTPAVEKTAQHPVARPASEHHHGYMAHLASYRDEIHAAAGWKTLQKAHRDLLINRSPVTMTAEIPGQGTFVRLMADGFSQLAEVAEFCSEIKVTGQYCIPVKGK
jgi:hypothetical protein